MKSLTNYIKANKSPLISLSEKLIVNKDYVEEQLPEYMTIITNPKVHWKSYGNRAVTESKIWGELCSVISKLKSSSKDRGNATKESPSLFTLSEKSKSRTIHASKPLAQKIFAGNDVFYIRPLKPGYKRSGIEISRRELDPRESGRFDGDSATGHWKVDKDVAVSCEGYAVSPDLINELISIMEEE